MVSVFNKGDKMFENQIATLTTILKDKDIHNYMGDTFWNIIKAVSLGDIGALLDSSIDIKNMLFHAPSVLFWDKMQRYMFGTFRNYAEQVKMAGKFNEKGRFILSMKLMMIKKLIILLNLLGAIS